MAWADEWMKSRPYPFDAEERRLVPAVAKAALEHAAAIARSYSPSDSGWPEIIDAQILAEVGGD